MDLRSGVSRTLGHSSMTRANRTPMYSFKSLTVASRLCSSETNSCFFSFQIHEKKNVMGAIFLASFVALLFKKIFTSRVLS